jgi:hypothetical protein
MFRWKEADKLEAEPKVVSRTLSSGPKPWKESSLQCNISLNNLGVPCRQYRRKIPGTASLNLL